MKKPLFLLTASLLLAQGLLAEYPKDAAARFKMKHGITHPVAEREAKAAAKEEKSRQAKAQPEHKTDSVKSSAEAEDTAAPNSSPRL